MAVEYSQKINVPQYEPSGKDLSLTDLVNVDKYITLLQEIDNALKENKITENEAKFLKIGATRWIKFNYQDIGDYYISKAGPEFQRLIERSALVIIDVDNALANEVVNCKKFIDDKINEWQQSVDFKFGDEKEGNKNIIDELF